MSKKPTAEEVIQVTTEIFSLANVQLAKAEFVIAVLNEIREKFTPQPEVHPIHEVVAESFDRMQSPQG